MASRQTIADITAVLELYFDGLYRADSKTLASVFHEDARYVNMRYGDYMNYSMPEYFKVVDGRTPSSESNQVRADEIISIEVGGSEMAIAKVSMQMLGRYYLDFLTLVHEESGWRIMSKVFSYNQTKEESLCPT